MVTGIYPDTKEIFYDIVEIVPTKIKDTPANSIAQNGLSAEIRGNVPSTAYYAQPDAKSQYYEQKSFSGAGYDGHSMLKKLFDAAMPVKEKPQRHYRSITTRHKKSP